MVSRENLEFKGPIRSNEQYCLVGYPLNCTDGHNVDLLISRDINDDFMVITKGVEQDPDLGVKIVHPSLMMVAMPQKAKKRKILMIIPPKHPMMVKM